MWLLAGSSQKNDIDREGGLLKKGEGLGQFSDLKGDGGGGGGGGLARKTGGCFWGWGWGMVLIPEYTLCSARIVIGLKNEFFFGKLTNMTNV